MTAIKLDICIDQGTDWSMDFAIEDPADLTGASAAMQIRTRNGATYIATLLSSNGSLIIDATTQKITAKLTNAITSLFVPEVYVYDIKIKDKNNLLYRAYQGNANVSGEVTLVIPPAGSGNVINTEGGIGITTEDGQKIITEG